MADYIIAAASTSDLPDTFFTEHDVPVIRYTYSIGMQVFEDDCSEESRQKAYEDMRRGTVYATSMINTSVYAEFFRNLLRTGKDVLYLDMSKEMSSSYKASHEAAELVQAEFPSQRLCLMDTRCISGGLGLLVTECVRRMENGDSLDEVIAWGEANKLKIMHRFTVDDLNYLKRGGRVSNASALIGSLLGIKPVLYVPDDGKLTVAQKVRGRKAAIQALFEGVKRDMKNPDGQTIVINHADCLDDANKLREMLLKEFPSLTGVNISNLGVIIGSHCGPGLLTVFYFGDQRKP
ncbi:MAG: DegV family protein [Oscillospiraceae bacterium]|nr:DegV family protein [Oscillospiraceae bacterium]